MATTENSMAQPAAVSDLLNLAGEKVLVTGASGNIGGAIARRLDEAGAHIIAHYHHNQAAVEALVDEMGSGQILQADLSDAAAVERLLADGDPTQLVHNAAAQQVQNIADMSLSEWQAMQAANLDSAFLLTQGSACAWQAQGHAGAIVNIASIEALDPAAGHAHYATSKAGMVMLSRAAALEFGAAGIRVNCVSPGLIDREGLASDWPEGVARWHERVPLGCIGTPNDVADAVLFLLSPAARWISGENLVVDGGMMAQGKW